MGIRTQIHKLFIDLSAEVEMLLPDSSDGLQRELNPTVCKYHKLACALSFKHLMLRQKYYTMKQIHIFITDTSKFNLASIIFTDCTSVGCFKIDCSAVPLVDGGQDYHMNCTCYIKSE